MTSWRPYLCPKTMKRRPCWCPKPVLWELNFFLMQTLSFVPINLQRCWPREWKHSIELFSLYVLFSQYRSCDNTLENCFSQISSCSRAYLRVIYEKTKSQVPPGPLLGKQNIQAKDVYYGERSEPRENTRETEHPSHSRDFSRLPQMVGETAHLPKFGYPSL